MCDSFGSLIAVIEVHNCQQGGGGFTLEHENLLCAIGEVVGGLVGYELLHGREVHHRAQYKHCTQHSTSALYSAQYVGTDMHNSAMHNSVVWGKHNPDYTRHSMSALTCIVYVYKLRSHSCRARCTVYDHSTAISVNCGCLHCFTHCYCDCLHWKCCC